MFTTSGGLLPLAICLFWLAALWLALAWRSGDARILAAHQAALTAATLVATTAWLATSRLDRGLSPRRPRRSAHLADLWRQPGGVVAVVDRGEDCRPHGRTGAAAGFSAACSRIALSVDRAVRYAVVAGQWLVLAAYVLPGEALRELNRGLGPGDGAQRRIQQAFGPPAWILLAVLGVIAVAGLWDRWGRADLVAALLVGRDRPVPVWPDRFSPIGPPPRCCAGAWPSPSCSCRSPSGSGIASRRCGAKARACIAVGPEGPAIARVVLLATTALPVVGLTVLAAMVRLGGTLPADRVPEPSSPTSGRSGPASCRCCWSSLGLVGFALRERSAGYAFSAGLVLELAVTLGYTLWTLTAKLPFDVSFFVTLAQLATITAAGWAILWLAARRRLKPPATRPPTTSRG